MSGTEHSSAWAKKKKFEMLKNNARKIQNDAEAKRDCVLNPPLYISNIFKHENIWCSQTLRINRSRP